MASLYALKSISAELGLAAATYAPVSVTDETKRDDFDLWPDVNLT